MKYNPLSTQILNFIIFQRAFWSRYSILFENFKLIYTDHTLTGVWMVLAAIFCIEKSVLKMDLKTLRMSTDSTIILKNAGLQKNLVVAWTEIT